MAQVETFADFLRTSRYARQMNEPGVIILIYIVAVIMSVVISYWVIRLAVLHAIRDSRKPEKVVAAQEVAPPTTTWFNKDA